VLFRSTDRSSDRRRHTAQVIRAALEPQGHRVIYLVSGA